jgi:hypothetical protein
MAISEASHQKQIPSNTGFPQGALMPTLVAKKLI